MRQSCSLCALVALVLLNCQTKSKEDDIRAVVGAMPWMLQVLELCEEYKGIKNETRQGEISRAGVNLIRKSSVSGVRGIVGDMLPPSPGKPDELYLQIKVGSQVRFATQSKKRTIKKEEPLFAIAAKLREEQCVIFSAVDLEPIAGFQQGKVCDPRYYARFTKIEPCPP